MKRQEELQSLIDKQSAAKLKVLLRDVESWPIRPSQSASVERHFRSKELLQDFNSSEARLFLRECLPARPQRVESWPSLVGAS